MMILILMRTHKHHKIGNKLKAIKSFNLTDVYQKEYYYGIGDEFIIMDINFYNNTHIEFNLNTIDSLFTWCIPYKDVNEFDEHLVHENNFQSMIRKKKLLQLKKYEI